MRKTIAFIVATTLLVSACSPGRKGDPTAAEGGGVPNGLHVPTPHGSKIGNGMTSYENARLGIRFEYPESWTLLEYKDRVELSNKNIAKAEFTSSISFGLFPEIDGRRMHKLDDLRQYLADQKKGQKWQKGDIRGRQGYWTETIAGSRRTAEYYLLDENRNVLHIRLHTVASLDGDTIVNEIIRSLTIDVTGPVIKSVKFSKVTAGALEEVKLLIEAEDEGSGLDVKRMGQPDANPIFHSVRDNLRYSYAADDPNSKKQNAFPIVRKNFKQVDATHLEYAFTVPKNAKVGTIRLGHLEILDRKGNRSSVGCSFEKKLQCFSGNPSVEIAPITFQVEHGKQKDYFEDKTGPKVGENYFGKTFIHPNSTKQEIYIRIDDETEVAPFAYVVGTDRKRTDGQLYSSCVKWSENLIHVEENLYRIEGSTENCFHNGKPNSDYLSLWSIRVFDQSGNTTEARSDITFEFTEK